MILTGLAFVFLLLLSLLAVFGYKVLGDKGPEAAEKTRCSVCRQPFGKEELLVRQVGDHKLMYFCRGCVLGLWSDLGMKN